MKEVFSNLVSLIFNRDMYIGIIVGFISAFILYILSRLYKPNYKTEFNFILKSAMTNIYQIHILSEFSEDYDLIISQISELKENAFEMYKLLLPLAMFGRFKEKKMIITLLYDIINVCNVSRYLTFGCENEKEEKRVRIKKIREYFFRIDDFETKNCFLVDVQLNLMGDIINGKSLKKAFRNEFKNFSKNEFFIRKVEEKFININSFRDRNDKENVRKNCLTEKQYIKIINSVMKKQLD